MQLNNYIGGSWQGAGGADFTAVTNPANGEELAQVRLSTKEDVSSCGKGGERGTEKMGTRPRTETRRLFI